MKVTVTSERANSGDIVLSGLSGTRWRAIARQIPPGGVFDPLSPRGFGLGLTRKSAERDALRDLRRQLTPADPQRQEREVEL